MSVGGTFAPGVPVASTPSRGDIPNGNCERIIAKGGFTRALWTYPQYHGPLVPIVAFAVSAREIHYDDGTVWKADNLPQTGDLIALPKNPPPTGPVVNHDARVAKLVRTGYALVNADGKVLGVQTADSRGKYSAGIPIEDESCAKMDGKWRPDGTLEYTDPQTGASGRVARIVTSVVEVDFTDGTSWQAATPPKPGDTLGG